MITTTIFMILFLNDHDDDIKMLVNIYNRIANGNSWSLITPSLDLYQELSAPFRIVFSLEEALKLLLLYTHKAEKEERSKKLLLLFPKKLVYN